MTLFEGAKELFFSENGRYFLAPFLRLLDLYSEIVAIFLPRDCTPIGHTLGDTHKKFSIPMLPVATLAKKTTTVCWVRFSTFASCYLPTNPKRGPNEANRKFIIIQRKTLSPFSTPKMGATTIPPFSRTRKRLVGAVPFRGYIGSSKFFIFLLLFLGWVDRVRDAPKMKRMPPPP